MCLRIHRQIASSLFYHPHITHVDLNPIHVELSAPIASPVSLCPDHGTVALNLDHNYEVGIPRGRAPSPMSRLAPLQSC